jgi:hypothetical protein
MMCGGKNITKEQCRRLNGALSLSKDDQALSLPSQLGKFISEDLDACTLAAKNAIRGDNKAAERAAQDFVRSIPSWLRYASDAFMLNDFQAVLAAHHRSR